MAPWHGSYRRDDDHAALVQEVKSIQRESPEGKELWKRLTDDEGGGVKDPARHQVGFLRRFLEEASQLPRSRPPHAPPHVPHQDLVARVKDLQRNGPAEAKEAWSRFCDARGGGRRDPGRHSPEFLQEFFAESTGTEQPPMEEPPGADSLSPAEELAHEVRQLECQSEDSKLLWHYWCELEGGYARQHTRNTPALLEGFISLMWDGPTKEAFRKDHASTPEMVEQVNALQRGNPTVSARWEQHCDELGGGTRDPRFHTAAFLQKFLEANEGEEAPSHRPRPIRPDRKRERSHGKPVDSWQQPERHVPDEEDGPGDVPRYSSTARDFVWEVEQVQRRSPEFQDAWGRFCDQHGAGSHDPRQHSSGFLQRFLEETADEVRQHLDETPLGELVRQVQEVLDSSEEWRDIWSGFCGGDDEPGNHDEALLRRFLGMVTDRSNEPLETEEQARQKELVSKVKAAQKAGRRENKAWIEFCESYGGGARDPSRHDSEYLQSFLDSLSQLPPPEEDWSGESPAKAPKKSAPWRSREKSREELIQEVRSVQWTSKEVKEQWHQFCAEHGGNTRDPARHTNEYLERFLSTLQEDIPQACGNEQNRKDHWVKAQQRRSDSEQCGLSSKVQAALASSREVRLAWDDFCDAKGCGIRDPTRHVPSFLQRFLSTLGTDDFEPSGDYHRQPLQPRPPAGPPSTIPARSRGKGKPTPPATPPPTHSSRYQEETSFPSKGRVPIPSRKRPREENGEASDDWSSLVAGVKKVQSGSKRGNEAWAQFCQEQGGGTCDPRRHEADFLRDFLASLPVELKEPAEAPPWRRDGEEPWQRRVAPRREAAAQAEGGPEKRGLVETVKQMQRSSKQSTEAWRDFCGREGGGTCDPNRHDVAFLQRFLQWASE